MITQGSLTRILDIQNGLNEPFNSVEKDNNSRFLNIRLTNGNVNFDITGCQVFLHTSFDMVLGKSQIENEGQIVDAKNGLIKLEISSNMTPRANTKQKFQVVVRKVNGVDNVDRITFPIFDVYVGERVIDDNYMIAENESEVLDTLHAVNIELQETIDRIGLENDAYTKPTLFGRIKQIYTYMTGTLITTITTGTSTITTIIGVKNPTSANSTTVMNYIKKVDDEVAKVKNDIAVVNNNVNEMIALAGTGSVIKSIQHIVAEGAGNVTIKAVNTNKSVIISNGFKAYTTYSSESPENFFYFLNSTTIYVYTNSNSSNKGKAYITVVEFY